MNLNSNLFQTKGFLHVGIHHCKCEFPEIYEWCATCFVEEECTLYICTAVYKYIPVDLLRFHGWLAAFKA